MKRMFAGVFGALLVAGLAVAFSIPAAAGGGYGRYGGYGGYDRYGPDCNCDGPVVKVVPAGVQVVTTRRVIHTRQVVPHVRVIDKNRVIVHRRTVLHRHIVLHRHNVEHRNITIKRINTAHKFQTVHKKQVVHQRQNTASRSHVMRKVKGRDCECAPGQKNFKGMAHWRQQVAISARN
jgi:hypothetical protein